jgi:hypothetical protein
VLYLTAAISCLFTSAEWHVLSGCASKKWMEWGACVDCELPPYFSKFLFQPNCSRSPYQLARKKLTRTDVGISCRSSYSTQWYSRAQADSCRAHSCLIRNSRLQRLLLPAQSCLTLLQYECRLWSAGQLLAFPAVVQPAPNEGGSPVSLICLICVQLYQL